MHSVLLFAFVAFQGAAAVQTPEYRNLGVGIAFTHPAEWKVTPKKDDARIVIPVHGGAAEAVLQIYAVPYRDTIEVYQLVQLRMNRQMRRQTVRQWQEEILGVPLVLTKSEEKLDGAPHTSLAGMLYSDSPKKFTFRLMAKSEDYDEAEYAFRKALQTLHTLDGSLPETENPNKPPPDPKKPEKIKPAKPPKVTVLGSTDGFKKAENNHPLKAAGRALVLYYPNGWTLTQKDEFTVTLKNADLPGEVVISSLSSLDFETPSKALLKASLEALKDVENVTFREETIPKPNRSGANVSYVWRTGTTKGSDVCTFDAMGASGDFYWHAKWTLKGAKATADHKKLLLALTSWLSLEPAP